MPSAFSQPASTAAFSASASAASAPAASAAATSAVPPISSPSQFTRVDGIGLWNSWTRNFKTPLLALLDLLDNAFDAALVDEQEAASNTTTTGHPQPTSSPHFPPFRGKLHITPDQHLEQNGVTTGVVITNNCAKPIKPLKNILEVYSSSKGKATESIGENGVGLKQGCATLSDLSFVVMKNNGTELSLGVLARELQKPEGCILPSFVFRSYDTLDLKAEMQFIFEREQREVGECVKHYGGGDLNAGINRLLLHFEVLKDKNDAVGGWGNDPNAFAVVLHEVRHGNAMHRTSQNVTEPAEHYESNKDGAMIAHAWQTEYANRAKNLMNTLYQELPRHYIHIPLSFDVRVNSHPVQFFYWQRRLVELTVFYPRIDSQTRFCDHPNWQDTGYGIRVFAGFDPVRLGDEEEGHALTLYVYSRRSGRLIKHEYDSRALLGLSNGGTSYCQGLTVIVDDCQGNLPLSPTKQDIAFGEEAHGDIHKENLYSWIGAIVNCYYNHHLSKFKGLKTQLTEAVRSFIPLVNPNDPSNVKLLKTLSLTFFSDISWFQVKKKIRNRKNYPVVQGADTKWHFEVPKKLPPKKVTRSPRTCSKPVNYAETLDEPEPVASLPAAEIAPPSSDNVPTSSEENSSDGPDNTDTTTTTTPIQRRKQRAQKSVEPSSRKRSHEDTLLNGWDEVPRKRNIVSYQEFDDDSDVEYLRKKKRSKKRSKKKKTSSEQNESTEKEVTIDSGSDDDSDDSQSDSDIDDIENELLNDVSSAVAQALEETASAAPPQSSASQPDQVGSMAQSTTNSAEMEKLKAEKEKLKSEKEKIAAEMQQANAAFQKKDLAIQELNKTVLDQNHQVESLKLRVQQMQQLIAQHDAEKKNLKKEFYNKLKTINELKQSLTFERKEKEAMQRETVYLKERERTNEQLRKEEAERVKLLESRVQHYQSQQEQMADDDHDQGVVDDHDAGNNNLNNLFGEAAQGNSAGTSLRSLFGGNAVSNVAGPAAANNNNGNQGGGDNNSFEFPLFENLC